MSTSFLRLVRIVGVTAAAVCWIIFATSPGLAAVKLIGDFEGNMASPYTVPDGADPDMDPDPRPWTTTPGGGVVPNMTFQFVNIHDVDYQGGVTHGDQALLINHPIDWNGGPYLRLQGDLQLLNDTADFPYLMFDVTTYGGPETPEAGPASRQLFTIFNNPVTGFYDAGFDNDIQQDPAVADFGQQSLTSTVIIDMTGPDPAVNDDNKVFLNLKSQQARIDHTDGTPLDPFYWQLLWVFIGEDTPATNPIQTIIDNVRFCSVNDPAMCQMPSGAPGDYNQDGTVNAADYVVWRDRLNDVNSLPNDDTAGVGPDDYTRWKANFGTMAPGSGAGLGAASSSVPEPSSGLVLLTCLVLLPSRRRIRD